MEAALEAFQKAEAGGRDTVEVQIVLARFTWHSAITKRQGRY